MYLLSLVRGGRCPLSPRFKTAVLKNVLVCGRRGSEREKGGKRNAEKEVVRDKKRRIRMWLVNLCEEHEIARAADLNGSRGLWAMGTREADHKQKGENSAG